MLLHHEFITECFTQLSGWVALALVWGRESTKARCPVTTQATRTACCTSQCQMQCWGLQPSALLKKPHKTQKYFSNTVWYCKINCREEGSDISPDGDPTNQDVPSNTCALSCVGWINTNEVMCRNVSCLISFSFKFWFCLSAFN